MKGTTRSAGPAILALASTLLIIFVAPFPVYALMSAGGLVEMPNEGGSGHFLLSVLVVKTGVALGFVLLLNSAFGVFATRWLSYGSIWWLMFAIVEAGQAIGPNYSTGDAVGGAIADAVYFPLAAWAAARLLGRGTGAV